MFTYNLDQKSGLARQLEEEKVELLSQLEEQTKKSKQLSGNCI